MKSVENILGYIREQYTVITIRLGELDVSNEKFQKTLC